MRGGRPAPTCGLPPETPLRSIDIPDPTPAVVLPETGLTELFGIADENLRAIEEAFGVRLAARGNEISVVGEGEAETVALRVGPKGVSRKNSESDAFGSSLMMRMAVATSLPRSG